MLAPREARLFGHFTEREREALGTGDSVMREDLRRSRTTVKTFGFFHSLYEASAGKTKVRLGLTEPQEEPLGQSDLLLAS